MPSSYPLAPADTADAVAGAAEAGEDLDALLAFAADAGRRLPPPGRGATAARWAVLTEVARVNLTAARVLEAHSDALAILDEAGAPPPTGTWGVFAAETPTDRLVAEQVDGAVRLRGTKPWCSLGGVLDHALVTAHVAEGRRLFRVDLRHPSVTARPADGWVARGLRTVTSVPLDLAGTPAEPVGDAGWYLTRPGFAWGGMGVAACWFGGALGVAATLRRFASRRRDDLTAMQLGAVEVALHGARAVLADAAVDVDAGRADGAAGATLALLVRSVVADAVERVVRAAGHAMGPAPLAFDADHAARVADLELYVRQHHAERDLAALGSALLDGEGTAR
ncbi:acyl-CoA dehydrogenase [Jatrophihabitans fulvus]